MMKVSYVRCSCIKEELLKKFDTDEGLVEALSDVRSLNELVEGFTKRVNKIIDSYINMYDKESLFFDEGSRREHREKLSEQLSRNAQQAYLSTVENVKVRLLDQAKTVISNLESVEGKFKEKVLAAVTDLLKTIVGLDVGKAFSGISGQLSDLSKKLKSLFEPLVKKIGVIKKLLKEMPATLKTTEEGKKGWLSSVWGGIKKLLSFIWKGIQHLLFGVVVAGATTAGIKTAVFAPAALPAVGAGAVAVTMFSAKLIYGDKDSKNYFNASVGVLEEAYNTIYQDIKGIKCV